ncbi:MAG: hypothetical protein KBF21_12480 [Thermoanaerobaculia bacterium]|jgi:hypothetical protein|nr:hypothetical protein [Thermoanaerobaculia bacterium]MBP9825033.1 hypothetical protein [Thermoanaerobaculia bacterium]
MSRFRLVPAIDENPVVIRLAQAAWGRVVLVALFLFLLRVSLRGTQFVDTAIVLVLVTLFAAHRRKILLFGALYWAGVHVDVPWQVLATLRPQLDEGVGLGDFGVFRLRILAAVLLLGALVHWLFRSRPAIWPARQPVWALLAFHGALLALLLHSPSHGLIWVSGWAFALAFGTYLWFFAYTLLDLRRNSQRGFVEQLGLFHPFWGSTNTPFPKGAAYVDLIEAKDPEALAISQLKGLKLLWWSLLLTVAAALLRALFFGSPLPGGATLPLSLPIPPLGIAFRASVAGQPFPWLVNWGAMFLELALAGLKLSIWGHQFIAVARISGFQARRNTYKPFLATSVSEFFNRYYYYFKELLVDCFFYPVFYALPRRRPKTALFVATLAAAGFGNFVYHLFRDVHVLAERGLLRTLVDSQGHALYCLLLASAIFVSQVRRMGRAKAPKSRLAEWRAILGVWIVFALLTTLYVDMRNTRLVDHLRFLADALPRVVG